MFVAVLVGRGVVLVYLMTSDHGSDRPLKKAHFFFSFLQVLTSAENLVHTA